MRAEWIARAIVFFVLFLLALSIRRRREAIRHTVRRVIIVEATYVLVVYFMAAAHRTPLESLLAGVVSALLVNQMFPGRSRHVPASVRRKKVAEYELTTGRKFNPRTHELDHEVPFSKGGSHTDD